MPHGLFKGQFPGALRLLLPALLGLLLVQPVPGADDLPDIGSPADTILSKDLELQIGPYPTVGEAEEVSVDMRSAHGLDPSIVIVGPAEPEQP